MMRATASFECDGGRWCFLEEFHHLPTRKLLAQDWLLGCVHAMQQILGEAREVRNRVDRLHTLDFAHGRYTFSILDEAGEALATPALVSGA
ncbi:hypothetical protein [Mesorhizobium sp. M0006]|uniref:hypothetical protein n=1 Tax=Mesorhizobium sp. M0006 TaxID=2956838 RepID=UPI0033398955